MGDSSDIEVRALRTFENELPNSVIENEEAQDKQHLDYTLHLRERGRPMVQFAAQVKGFTRRTGQKKKLSRRFKREHLEYWVDRSRLPVLLILVDVKKQRAYFRFVHEWAAEAGEAWRKHASSTVAFRPKDRVSDHARFLAAIRRADVAMNQLGPKRELARLRGIDNRLDYSLAYDPSGDPMTTIRAKQTVEANFAVKGDASTEKFRRMIRTGQPQEFAPGELKMGGGGFFDHIAEESKGGPVWFQMRTDRDCHLAIITEDAAGTETRAIEGLRGELHGGTHHVEYDASLRGGPLGVAGHIDVEDNGDWSGEFRLSLDVDQWVGQRLPNLQNLERIVTFADSLRASVRTGLEFTIDGVRAGTIGLEQNLIHSLLDQLGGRLRFYHGLAIVAERLSVHPRLGDLSKLTDEALDQLGALVEICREGSLSVPAKHATTKVKVALDPSKPFRLEDLGRGNLLLTENLPASLFGEESEELALVRHVGPFVLTKACVASLPESLDGEEMELEVESASGAVIAYELKTEAELAETTRLPARREDAASDTAQGLGA